MTPICGGDNHFVCAKLENENWNTQCFDVFETYSFGIEDVVVYEFIPVSIFKFLHVQDTS